MRKLKLKTISLVLLVLGFSGSMFAYDFPYVFFFPFWPGFSFYMMSESGNTIEVETSIEMTDDYDDSGILYMEWDMDWNRDGSEYNYILNFMVDSDGNVYLSEIDDGTYSRMIFDMPMVFPDDIEYDTDYELGYGLTLNYVDRLSEFTTGERTFYDVIQARFSMADIEFDVYFGEWKGIIEIQAENETYSYSY